MTTSPLSELKPSDPSKAETTARGDLGRFVSRQVMSLQTQYLRANRTGHSDATLARLRRAVTTLPGEDPSVWAITLDGVPFPGNTDEPSRSERAAHTALTLYAVHQQSQRRPMHQPGVSLGHAMHSLAGRRNATADPDRESAVRRRFDVLLTADSYEEINHHLRGLILQLRGEELGLDYGLLAQDLDALQVPSRAPGVRLRWGRDYHRKKNSMDDAPTDTDPTGTDNDDA